MLELNENLNEALNESFNRAYQSANNMSYRHGDSFKEDSFKNEHDSEYYIMIIKQMSKMINHPLFFHWSGVYKEHDQIKFVNPSFSVSSEEKMEYYVYGEVIIIDSKWAIKYENNILDFEECKID